MSSFSKFLTKYAMEIQSVGGALTTIIAGVALPPKERAKVQEVIAGLEAAANSIADNIKRVTDPKVVISKDDIKKAVADALPAIIKDEVKKAVAVALEENNKLTDDAVSVTIKNEVKAQLEAMTVDGK